MDKARSPPLVEKPKRFTSRAGPYFLDIFLRPPITCMPNCTIQPPLSFFSHRTVCKAFPAIEFYLSPTTPRSTPSWFSPCQADISRLVQQQVQDQQTPVLPIPGYLCDPSHLDADGVHFLPTYGQHYCMHVIDTSR